MDNENLKVAVANDNLNPEEVTLEVKLYDFSGTILWQEEIDTVLLANTSHVYLSVPRNEVLAKGTTSRMVFEVVIKAGNEVVADNLYYFDDCKTLQLGKATIKKEFSKVGEQDCDVILSTDQLVKNVALFTLKSEGSFSDNYFDMIPGKNYKIRFTGNIESLEEDLYLMSVNNTYHD